MTSKNSSHNLPLGKLGEFLASHLGNSMNILSAKEFSGGASNPTYLLKTTQGDYVLRSKPQGKLISKAHAIDREYRVMNALGKTDFPVPKMHLYCDNSEVIGAEFYLMEYINGRVFEDFTLPNISKNERAEIYESMNATMAHLHKIDPDAIGLSDYGKAGNYFERQISLWFRQYQHQDDTISRFENLAEWLKVNIVKDEKRTIIHGDFTLANIILKPDAPEVAAVLDWELSTLGHPLADFTYNLYQWYLPSFNRAFGKITLAEVDVTRLGIPEMETYAKSYYKKVGTEISPKELYYGIAFNLYRLSGIVIGIIGRAKSGTAKNEFARSVAHNLDPMLDLAWHYVKKADQC